MGGASSSSSSSSGASPDERRRRQPQPQPQPPPHPLASMLRFGTHRERAAEMATDSMRALLLELAGYDVQVFEFIGGGHTAKNVMIAATKRRGANNKSKKRSKKGQQQAGGEAKEQRRRQRIRGELRELMALHGVRRQRLAEWMGELSDGGESPPSASVATATATATATSPPNRRKRASPRSLPPI